MANATLKIVRLRCDEPDDSLTDEVKMQQDGRQVWPNTGDGFFSMSTGNEVPIDLTLPFTDVTRISLFDDEDIGQDDRLGFVDIRRSEAGPTGVSLERNKPIEGQESRYTLFYKVRRDDPF